MGSAGYTEEMRLRSECRRSGFRDAGGLRPWVEVRTGDQLQRDRDRELGRLRAESEAVRVGGVWIGLPEGLSSSPSNRRKPDVIEAVIAGIAEKQLERRRFSGIRGCLRWIRGTEWDFGDPDRATEHQETNLLTYEKEEHTDATENTELSVDEVKELVEAIEPLERITEVEPPLEITTDLLGIEEIRSIASDIEQKNALALSIIQPEEGLRTATLKDLLSSGSGWELALVSSPSNNISNVVESKLAGGFDKLLLDSLYDDASRRQQISGDNSVGCSNVNSFEPSNPFTMPSGLRSPTDVPMTLMAQQQQQQYYHHHHYQQQLYYQQQQMSQRYQQQQQMMMVQYGYRMENHHLQTGQTNPFDVPFTEYSQNAPSQGNSSLI